MENEGEKIVSFKMPKPKKTVETLRSNVSVPSGNVSNLNGVVSNSADADVSPQTVAPEALQFNVSTVYREGNYGRRSSVMTAAARRFQSGSFLTWAFTSTIFALPVLASPLFSRIGCFSKSSNHV